MNKKILSVVISSGLLWSFVIGFFIFNKVNIAKFLNNNSAAVILSGNISEKNSVGSTSSTKIASVSILAFGDMMLDRAVRQKMNENGNNYPFVYIKEFLQGNDIVVANAEGSFTKNNSVTMGIKDGPLQFTFDPEALSVLKKYNFTLFSQANNHTLNFGLSGFEQSSTSITNSGLNWFGDPRNFDKTFYQEIRGKKIAFVGYNEFAYSGYDKVIKAIKDAKLKADFVIVYPHWGEEYKTIFNASQQKKAHEFIDAGADVVIGAHPHVIQPIEIYKHKAIFYSLGNFIFDQSANGPTGKGLAVRINISNDEVKYELFPFKISKQQAVLMNDIERQIELEKLEFPSGLISLKTINN